MLKNNTNQFWVFSTINPNQHQSHPLHKINIDEIGDNELTHTVAITDNLFEMGNGKNYEKQKKKAERFFCNW